MNTKCKCGGRLEPFGDKRMKIPYLLYKCPNCKNVVSQRKRRPYKINAEKDIRNIRLLVEDLVDRNPVTEKNREEWDKFLHEYLTLWTELNKIVNKPLINLQGGK